MVGALVQSLLVAGSAVFAGAVRLVGLLHLHQIGQQRALTPLLLI